MRGRWGGGAQRRWERGGPRWLGHEGDSSGSRWARDDDSRTRRPARTLPRDSPACAPPPPAFPVPPFFLAPLSFWPASLLPVHVVADRIAVSVLSAVVADVVAPECFGRGEGRLPWPSPCWWFYSWCSFLLPRGVPFFLWATDKAAGANGGVRGPYVGSTPRRRCWHYHYPFQPCLSS